MSISESDKLGRGAPKVPKKKSNERVRITIQQKMQAVQHFQANKGMTQTALIEWCFHKLEMKKKAGQRNCQCLVQGRWKRTKG
jgi:hypothetical protein